MRRQSLILLSLISFPVFFERNVSRNCKVDVILKTSEFSHPPRDHGEAITMGTRYPRPTGLSRASFLFKSLRPNSSCIVTYSSEVSIPLETFPLSASLGFGATKGGT